MYQLYETIIELTNYSVHRLCDEVKYSFWRTVVAVMQLKSCLLQKMIWQRSHFFPLHRLIITSIMGNWWVHHRPVKYIGCRLCIQYLYALYFIFNWIVLLSETFTCPTLFSVKVQNMKINGSTNEQWYDMIIRSIFCRAFTLILNVSSNDAFQYFFSKKISNRRKFHNSIDWKS